MTKNDKKTDNEINLQIVDKDELDEMKKKNKKIQQVMDIIIENNLQDDKEFMDAVSEAINWVWKNDEI